MLASLLQPSVKFPVQQVTENVALEPNNVYVIPPNFNLSAVDTHLRLTKLEEHRRERAPIDHFFRTLATTYDGHSIGVILTGTGSDGTLGLKEIKAMGGLILVQDPNDAEFDGMPQSAIATGLVDRVLPIAEIASTLVSLANAGPRVAIFEDSGEQAYLERVLLPKVLTILRARTDRDFHRYKPATILRRIARRMQLSYIDSFDRYLEKLRESLSEVRALSDDLLINVTSFFRDPDVFERLANDVIPQLFSGKGANDAIRVWSVGCATGEEAYSVAMLLLEESARRDSSPLIQIFASDLHKRSLDGAREGFYPGDIETDVSPERIRRFFRKENGGFRIVKEVRETVVFAPHNLLGDPPFSRVDLITCRNLLIYLDRSVQRDVIDLFHYALCRNGYLILGSAETIDSSELFRTEDKKLRIYQKRNLPVPELRLPVFPGTRTRAMGELLQSSDQTSPNNSYHSLHKTLLERYAPPSILVGPDNRLAHLSEHAGRYLTHPGGELTSNVLRLVRDELRIELQALLQSVRDAREPVDSRPIFVRFDGQVTPVVMHVSPAGDSDGDDYVLVIFEEQRAQSVGAEQGIQPQNGWANGSKFEMDEDVAAAQRLRAIIEEYETSQEEMKAANEEMQSTNEELRSTMEELETSKEELQSINEELQTVNQENRHKVEELSQLSSDLQNLLAATDIATLFLDRELRIMRFTPQVAELYNIRITDRGRPISDLTHRLGYPNLQEDAQDVLMSLIPVQREIFDDRERWYLVRLLPYRSTDDRIEGVVITFTEITTQKRAEVALRDSEQRKTLLLKLTDSMRGISDPLAIQRAGVQVVAEMLGLSRAFYFQVEGEPQNWAHVIEAEYRRDPDLPSMIGRHPLQRFGQGLFDRLASGAAVEVADVTALEGLSASELAAYKALGVSAFFNVPLLRNGLYSAGFTGHDKVPRTWKPAEIALVREAGARIWDATDRARAEEALRLSEHKYRTLFDSIDEGYCILQVIFDDADQPLDWRYLQVNRAFELNNGLHGAEGRTIRELAPDIEPKWMAIYGRVAITGEALRFEEDSVALGRIFSLYAYRIGEPLERKVAVIFTDITQHRRAEEGIRVNEKRLRAQKEAFQSAINGSPLGESLFILSRLVADEMKGVARSGFFFVDPDGERLHPIPGAGDMPSSYTTLVDQLPVANNRVACGLAGATGVAGVTQDISSEPLWKPLLYLAEGHDFRGCWSFAVETHEHKPLGAFAMYLREPQVATPQHLALANLITQTAAIIISRDAEAQERARFEETLRESEERKEFLLKLTDGWRLLSDALAIQQNAARVIGEALGVDRVFFAEILPDDETAAVRNGYARDGFLPAAGNYRTSDFGVSSIQELRSGRLLNITDITAAPGLDDNHKAAFLAMQCRSTLVVPQLRGGQWVSNLVLQQGTPREWTHREIALVNEAAERTWVALERAAVDEALRHSEQRFRTLANTAAALIWQNDPDGNNVYVNQYYLDYTGAAAEQIRGVGWHSLVHPAEAAAYLAGYLDAVHNRQPYQNRNRIKRHDGEWHWFENYAQPLFDEGNIYRGHVGVSVDVNEQVEAEQSLRASEELRRLALASGRMGAWQLRLKERSITGDAVFSEFFGVPDSLSARPAELYLEKLTPKSREFIEAIMAQEFESGQEIEREILLRNGPWINWRGRVRMDDPAIMDGISFDVTDRVRTAEVLTENEDRLRTVLEGIPQLVWRGHDHGEWTWASSQWMSFTGQSQQQSIGRGWLDAVHPDDRELTQSAWVRADAEGVLDVEYRILRASDRTYVWHHARALPVRSPSGSILEWLGTSTDVEELKRTESARREAEENFRLFVENVQEYALVQTDPEGRIISWNPGAQRLFGYLPEQMIGQNFACLLTPEDQAAGVFPIELAKVTSGQRNEDARWFVREDNSRLWTRWISEPMFDETGRFRGLAKIMRDETERERADASTRHSLTEKEELLKEVHHRVKNNLQVIVSLLNMQAFQIHDEPILALFHETRNRVLAISSIHEQLYRAESFASIALTDYAKQLAPGLVRFYGLEDRVRIDIIDNGATLELERAVPYGMLLNELVANACKHAFPAPRTGTITLRVEPEDSMILLTVEDDGEGLPNKFDYRHANSLGLKLVHGLVRQLRGSLEISSHSGTTIKVRFPANGKAAEE